HFLHRAAINSTGDLGPGPTGQLIDQSETPRATFETLSREML
ncbi:MAG: hypothetical protein ACI915_005546, partial [Gammaproteobacteria bacterium]